MSQQEVVQAARAASALTLNLRVKVLVPPFGLARRHAGSTQSLNLPLSSSSSALVGAPRSARTLEDGLGHDSNPSLGPLTAAAPRLPAADEALLGVMGGGAAVAEAVSLQSRSSSPRARSRAGSHSEASSRTNSSISLNPLAAAGILGAAAAAAADSARSTASSPGLGDRELSGSGRVDGVLMRKAVMLERQLSSTEV
jgi:hypothetical protein